MSRQINLYSPAFRPQPKIFSAAWTVAAVVAIAAGMSAFYAWEVYQLPGLRPRRIEAEAHLKQLREQLVALGQTTQRTRNKALEDQVARAEIVLKSRQEFFGRLQSGEFGNRDGYAKFLAALARQHLEGVWLTGIEISGPGSDFAIEGRTIRADLLPGFIKMLRNETVLRGKPIGTLAMHEREIDPKGEQKAQVGPAGAVPAQGAQGAQGGPAGPPGVRVVEFTIGTGGTRVTAGRGHRAMTAYWKRFASLIDERATRERVLILVTSSLVVYMLMQSLLLGPVLAERRRLVQETQTDQAEMGRTSVQLQTLAREKTADPDAPLKTRLAELGERQAQLQRQIDAQSAELVPPEKMPAVLEKILANNPRLQLIEVKTLPRVSISLENETAPGAPAGQGREPKTPAADEKKPNEIYRHGVEVTMRGNYLDLLAYLMQIESLPVRMFWDKVSLSVTSYPNVTMRLVVYTISLEKVWLTV